MCSGILTYDTKLKLHVTECMYVACTVICHCSIVIDDHSRVIIQGNTSSDYINENNIDVSFA